MNALILAANFHFQYRVVRCAVNAGLKVFVLGEKKASPLRFSRFCQQYYRLRCSIEDPANQQHIVERINQLIKLKKIDIIIPADGFSTKLLANSIPQLDRPVFPIPSSEVFNQLDNKLEFSRVCDALEIPHPETFLLEDVYSLHDKVAAGKLQFPFMIKPAALFGGIGVKKIDKQDMDEILSQVDYAPILAQEFIDGEEFCISMMCHEGQTYSKIIYKKDRGEFYFLDENLVTSYASKIAQHFAFNGVICFDAIKRDDGEVFLIECNPRFWFNLDVAMFAGANFIKQALEFVENKKSFTDEKIKPSIRTMRAIVRRLIQPWTLTLDDFKVITYFASDPKIFLFFGKYFIRNNFRKYTNSKKYKC